MRLIRSRFVALVALALAAPVIASAKVDAACLANATSAVEGHIKNVKGDALAQVHVQLRQTNKENPVVAEAFTDSAGSYVICVGHDTYDVRAFDDLGGLYAMQNKAAQTFSDLSGDTDFTMEYKLNLTITPRAISIPNPGDTKLASWTVRSKAPCPAYPSGCTDMQLTVDHHPGTVFHPAFVGTEFGGPSSGGWNLWRYSETLANPLPEHLYWAAVAGSALNNAGQMARVTEQSRDPYVIDNTRPLFGPNGPPATSCGSGLPSAGPFAPPQTTNPRALVVVGACDPLSNGTFTGLDPYSLQVEVFDGALNPITAGTGMVSQYSVVFLPSNPLPLGTYRFRYTVKDFAGNATTSPLYAMQITSSGGQTPVISGFLPGNLGEGQNFGVVIGSGFTTPASRAVVAFYAKDADGQDDIVPGTLRVKIYGSGGATILYDYDSSLPCPGGAVPAPSNGGCFDLSTGRFEARGFSLVGRTPGVYVASASIEDHGGNATTRTWRWLQVFTA